MRRQIDDLKRFSFLVALNDPYIVLPGFMLRPPVQPFTPRLGDFAVVIYHGKLYPALLGDVGPSYKMGEGSLRLAAQLNPRANFANRPVSDPGVTYLIFCGGMALLPLGSSFLYVAFTVVVWTVGEMLVFPMLSTVVADRAGADSLGRYMGVLNLAAAMAFVTAPLAGTWVYQHLGMRALWFGCGGVGVLAWAGFRLLAGARGRALGQQVPGA